MEKIHEGFLKISHKKVRPLFHNYMGECVEFPMVICSTQAQFSAKQSLSSTIFTLCWLGCLSVRLCSSALGQSTDKCNTVLEKGQIAHEDPTIKNPNFP